MRLIDAEELILHLNDFALQSAPFKGEGSEAYYAISECIRGVEKQPTAYDVDKVVEQLEKEKFPYYLTLANTGNEKLDFAYAQVSNAIDEAIEIVKAGGVNENSDEKEM